MINLDEVKAVNLVSCTNNPEETLTNIVYMSNDINEVSLNPEELYDSMVKEGKFEDSLTFIHLIINVKTDITNLIDMNLVTLLSILKEGKSKTYCNSLFNAVSSEFPYFMTAIGKAYGYDFSDIITIGYSSVSNSISSDNSVTTTARAGDVIRGDEQSIINSRVSKLIADHWDFMEDVILVVTDGNEDFSIRAMEMMYKSAFKHGMKHQYEDNK
jgi:hypothetical protein